MSQIEITGFRNIDQIAELKDQLKTVPLSPEINSTIRQNLESNMVEVHSELLEIKKELDYVKVENITKKEFDSFKEKIDKDLEPKVDL